MSAEKTNINTEVSPFDKKVVSFNPGVPVYEVVVKNQDDRPMLASVSYNRATGELVVTVVTKRF